METNKNIAVAIDGSVHSRRAYDVNIFTFDHIFIKFIKF